MKTNTTPLTEDLREWVSPGGVTHLLDDKGCLTCGKSHEAEVVEFAGPVGDDLSLVSAGLYVQTRFYPPLPAEYAEYAVAAVRACREGEPSRVIVLDHRLPVHPKGAIWYGDTRVEVAASDLVEALRLWHMVDAA